MLTRLAVAAANAVRNQLVRQVWCLRIHTCDPDWTEAITLGLARPRCHNCRRPIP